MVFDKKQSWFHVTLAVFLDAVPTALLHLKDLKRITYRDTVPLALINVEPQRVGTSVAENAIVKNDQECRRHGISPALNQPN